MIQRCLAILIKALSVVFGGSVDIQYLVGSASPSRPFDQQPFLRVRFRFLSNPDEPGVRERRQSGIATSGLCLHAK